MCTACACKLLLAEGAAMACNPNTLRRLVGSDFCELKNSVYRTPGGAGPGYGFGVMERRALEPEQQSSGNKLLRGPAR